MEKSKTTYLMDHQWDAVTRMFPGCILDGGVGTGKSRTALFYYFTLNEGWLSNDGYIPMGDPPDDLYIITTAKKRDSREWDIELVPFLMSTNPDENMYQNNIVIDSWNNIKKYRDVKNAFFIFDEDRVTGNGAWVNSFLKIAKANKWIILSATPGDCWADYIPVFIANGFYKNKTEFVHEHIIYSRFTKYPKIDRYINTGRLIRLRKKILIHMDMKRHTILKDIYVDCNYDKLLYKSVGETRVNPYKTVQIGNRVVQKPIKTASELCYTWRKIVNSDASRSSAVLDIAKKHNRLIIFYNFDYERDILLNLDYGDDVIVAEWTGYKHQEIPDSYKWIYLVQYTSGNEGWNCIKTNAILFYSQTYSYKVLTQAKGRINRMNTGYTYLYYYHLTAHSNIELGIAKAIRNKKKFNEGGFVKNG